MTQMCANENCQAVASHALLVMKDEKEYRFFGCQQHFMDICSYYMNNGGYSYKGTETLSQASATKSNSELVENTVPKPVVSPPSVVARTTPEIPAVPELPNLPDFEDEPETPSISVQPSTNNVPSTTLLAPSKDEGRGVAIDQIGRMRAVIDEAEAKEAGFTVARPLYATGTKVVQAGVDNFRRSRQEWEARPKVEEACDELIQTIKSEDRQDVLWPMNEIVMLPDGRITHDTGDDNYQAKGSIVLANSSILGQLMARSALDTSGRGYLERCPPMLRALNVNSWLQMTAKGVSAKLRTRKVLQDREIFGVVSPRYAVFDADEIAEITKSICPSDARAEIAYNGFNTRMNITFHSDIKPEDAVAGEIFKVGVSIKTAVQFSSMNNKPTVFID